MADLIQFIILILVLILFLLPKIFKAKKPPERPQMPKEKYHFEENVEEKPEPSPAPISLKEILPEKPEKLRPFTTPAAFGFEPSLKKRRLESEITDRHIESKIEERKFQEFLSLDPNSRYLKLKKTKASQDNPSYAAKLLKEQKSLRDVIVLSEILNRPNHDRF